MPYMHIRAIKKLNVERLFSLNVKQNVYQMDKGKTLQSM